uniref:DUF6535 domain-containing protein n=1 Tax=Moniliophthora roreri TaxID=221103 RepID=A0A0W0G5R9_MONRR
MSSGDLTADHSSSPSTSIAGRSRSQESMDPTQIPLPPSKAGSNEVRDTIISLNAVIEVDLDLQSMNTLESILLWTVWEEFEKAGLFSAVVTAFAIESYQWLDEDPAVTLLTQLISIQANGTQATSIEPTHFKPDASSICINIFWFLSLILSLASALFGLLCKQWVREHQRDTTTRTPGEALALCQLRQDSFEKWGVSSFLSALPILLEVALLLFFVSVLDLLWNRHPVPFAICFIAVSLSVGLYFLTMLLPTLTVPRDQMDDIRNRHFNRLSYQFICPYKSPQACYQQLLLQKISTLLGSH